MCYALSFNIAPTWGDIPKQLIQSYPLFLLYPRIESVLQWLLLLRIGDS